MRLSLLALCSLAVVSLAGVAWGRELPALLVDSEISTASAGIGDSPCDAPEFRQFDFWLGDWDVSSAADGIHRGSSHVSREMGGCVIWENWTSAKGPYFGKSYNTWNPNLKRWEQYWVDTSAGVMFFHGQLKNDVMDYWTDDVSQAAGGTLLRHLQFFNLGPDKVRQFSQRSNDGGHTWHTEYDLIYTRVKAGG